MGAAELHTDDTTNENTQESDSETENNDHGRKRRREDVDGGSERVEKECKRTSRLRMFITASFDDNDADSLCEALCAHSVTMEQFGKNKDAIPIYFVTVDTYNAGKTLLKRMQLFKKDDRIARVGEALYCDSI